MKNSTKIGFLKISSYDQVDNKHGKKKVLVERNMEGRYRWRKASPLSANLSLVLYKELATSELGGFGSYIA